MKKRILAAVLSAAMVMGALAGCGAPKTAQGDTAASTAGETTGETAGEKTAETAADTAAAESAKADGENAEAKTDGAAKKFKILSIWAEDTKEGKLLYNLTKQYQEEVNPNFEFEFELVSANDLTTKIATLVASNDLPDAFAYVAGQPLTELINADKVVNISEQLETLGVSEQIEEGAATLLKGLSNTDSMYDLPLGLNIEGFWYNKKVFADAGVEVPKTWDELLTVCDTIKAKGVQPMSIGGSDKWPLSRLVNAYVIRTMGVDALTKATAGELSFTDPKFIEAATQVSNMGEKGYFGEGVTTVDQTTAGNMMLAGESAMCYNGSWFTEDITSENNPAGEDGIGFFSIPVVDEAISPATEIPMNCGNILALSKDKYDDATADWLKYFVEHAGDYAMKEMGSVKGYKYTVDGELSPINKTVVENIDSVTNAATWFEAMMNNETKTAAQDNVQTLVNGEMTPEEYMQSIQDAFDLSK